MKNIVLALFALWFVSLNLGAPAPLSIVLGAGFVSALTVALAGRLARPRVNNPGSLGL